MSYAVRLCGGWNNSYMLMGDIFDHMEKHGCHEWPKKKRACWRRRKMEIAFDKLKARGQ